MHSAIASGASASPTHRIILSRGRPGLLNPDVADVAVLVLVRVLDRLEIGEADAAAVRHAPAQLAGIELAAERLVDFAAALDLVPCAPRGLARNDGGGDRGKAVPRSSRAD